MNKTKRELLYLGIAAGLGYLTFFIAVIYAIVVDRMFPADSRVGLLIVMFTPILVMAYLFTLKIILIYKRCEPARASRVATALLAIPVIGLTELALSGYLFLCVELSVVLLLSTGIYLLMHLLFSWIRARLRVTANSTEITDRSNSE